MLTLDSRRERERAVGDGGAKGGDDNGGDNVSERAVGHGQSYYGLACSAG